jgi:hypothetical protein
MAILNKSSDGLVSVLVAMVRTSVLMGEMPRHKLLDICCPKSLVGDAQDMGTNTLNRWHELGLFQITDDKRVTVVNEFRKELKKCNASLSAVAEVARRIILAPSNNENFWSDKENKASDFTRAAAWMLAQDVHAFTPTSHASVEPLCNDQALSSDVILLQNDTRWPGYKSWATFLGFGRSESGKASGAFLTDPTNVVASYVTRIIPKKEEVPIEDFIHGLAQSVPVLDRGEYRQQVERKLKPERWKAPASMDLSTSLSRALLRLRSQGVIRLEKRSDSDAQLRLIGLGGSVVESVTHVQRGETI